MIEFKGLSGLASWRGHFENLANKAPDLVLKAALDAANDVFIPPIIDRLVSEKISWSGQLAASLTVFGDLQGSSLEVGITAVNINYAQMVEFGTGPRPIGSKEFKRLTEWVATKVRPNQSYAAAKRTARFIKKHIEYSGSEEHPYATPVVEARKDHFVTATLDNIRRRMGI